MYTYRGSSLVSLVLTLTLTPLIGPRWLPFTHFRSLGSMGLAGIYVDVVSVTKLTTNRFLESSSPI